MNLDDLNTMANRPLWGRRRMPKAITRKYDKVYLHGMLNLPVARVWVAEDHMLTRRVAQGNIAIFDRIYFRDIQCFATHFPHPPWMAMSLPSIALLGAGIIWTRLNPVVTIMALVFVGTWLTIYRTGWRPCRCWIITSTQTIPLSTVRNRLLAGQFAEFLDRKIAPLEHEEAPIAADATPVEAPDRDRARQVVPPAPANGESASLEPTHLSGAQAMLAIATLGCMLAAWFLDRQTTTSWLHTGWLLGIVAMSALGLVDYPRASTARQVCRYFAFWTIYLLIFYGAGVWVLLRLENLIR